MDKTRKVLLTELISSCIITLLIIAVYELKLILPGGWADAESSNMVTMQFLMQLLTLAAIPLSLFLFKIGYVRSDLHTDESHVSRKLLFWGSVRMMMLCMITGIKISSSTKACCSSHASQLYMSYNVAVRRLL